MVKNLLNSATQSATKFCLILLVGCLCTMGLYLVLMNPHNENVISTTLGLFSAAAVGVISFYFGQKSVPTAQESRPE